MLKISIIVGTRPEAIKIAPIYKACLNHPDVTPTLVSTGQHRELLDQVLETFDIAADVDLGIMKAGQSLSLIISSALSGLDALFEADRPDVVLAQGDTATVLAAGLASFNRNIAFGHVEAGLRTRDLDRPHPEEGYRQMVQRVARWNFAPTQKAMNALSEENLSGSNHLVGNTVIDALLDVSQRQTPSPFVSDKKRYVLITGHRRENFGERFERAFGALKRLAETFPDTDFVYPVHLNPNVQKMAHSMLAGTPNFHLIDPQPYASFVTLMKNAHLILTDSGGIQEEAPSFDVPVLVMRDKTEREEGVEAGVAKLVGADPELIFAQASKLLRDDIALDAMRRSDNPFGDGKSASRIVDVLVRDMSQKLR